MNQKESIKQIENYFINFNKRKEEEENRSSNVREEIRNNISFKNEPVVKTFLCKSGTLLDLIHYPVDIESMQEKLVSDYEVVFDDRSEKFYDFSHTSNLVYQYIILLPKRENLKPIGIIILRNFSDVLIYNDLYTGIVVEKSHKICLEEMESFSSFVNNKPLLSSHYSDLEEVSINEEYKNNYNNYIRNKILNTSIKVYLEKDSFTSNNHFSEITEEIIKEALDVLEEFDKDDVYKEEKYLTETSCINVIATKKLQKIDCNAIETLNNKYIGKIPIEILITEIEIEYVIKDKKYKTEYSSWEEYSKEGLVSEFIS